MTILQMIQSLESQLTNEQIITIRGYSFSPFEYVKHLMVAVYNSNELRDPYNLSQIEWLEKDRHPDVIKAIREVASDIPDYIQRLKDSV